MELTTIYTIIIVAEICRFIYGRLQSCFRNNKRIRKANAARNLIQSVTTNIMGAITFQEFKPLNEEVRDFAETLTECDIPDYKWDVINMAYRLFAEKYLGCGNYTDTPICYPTRYNGPIMNDFKTSSNINVPQRRPFMSSQPVGGSCGDIRNYFPTTVNTNRHINPNKPALTEFIAENTGDQTSYCQCDETCANNCVICAVNGPCKSDQITNLHDEMGAAIYTMICENSDYDSSEDTIPAAPSRDAPTAPVPTEEPTIETIDDPELITTREPRFHPLR